VLDRESAKRAAREIVIELTRRKVRDDQYLVSSGLIDSLLVLSLISKLEQKLHIRIPTKEVQPEDFDTLDLILETVERVGVA